MGARRGLCGIRPGHAAGRTGRGYLWALHGDLAGRGLPACGLDGHDPGARVPRGSATRCRCRQRARSLARAVSPAGIRTRRRHCRTRSRQSCHVRFLCGDPLDRCRHRSRHDGRALVGVGCGRSAGLSVPGSAPPRTAQPGRCAGRFGGFRLRAFRRHGADRRCDGARAGAAPARIHLCAAPPRLHARHRGYRAARFGGNGAGRLWPRRGWRRHRRPDGRVGMAVRALRTQRLLGHGRALHSCTACRRLVASRVATRRPGADARHAGCGPSLPSSTFQRHAARNS